MKALQFLGIESGFGVNNTSAYTVINNNLLLIDCGGTVFGQLLTMDRNSGFLKSKDQIEIIITHLHDDHIGSLSTLILYCAYVLNKKPIIHSKCPNIKERMQLCAVSDTLYEIKDREDIEFIRTEHDSSLECYGFKMTINGKTILYTGDTATMKPFLEKIDGVSELYVDTNVRKSSVHVNLFENLDVLKALTEMGIDVYLMHLDDESKTRELIDGTAIRLASEDKLYKEDIIRILNEYDLDPNRYEVIMGAAMVLHGFKEYTSNIDLAVSKDYYQELVEKNNCSFERINSEVECILLMGDKINFGRSYYTGDHATIEGIPVITTERLKELKKSLNREKDKEELLLMEEKTY